MGNGEWGMGNGAKNGGLELSLSAGATATFLKDGIEEVNCL